MAFQIFSLFWGQRVQLAGPESSQTDKARQASCECRGLEAVLWTWTTRPNSAGLPNATSSCLFEGQTLQHANVNPERACCVESCAGYGAGVEAAQSVNEGGGCFKVPTPPRLLLPGCLSLGSPDIRSFIFFL